MTQAAPRIPSFVVLGPRVLDSDAARFLSQDPEFNAVNQYAYAQGNPVFYWDPTGRDISGLGSLAFVGLGFGGLGSINFANAAAPASGPGGIGITDV